MAYTAEQKRIIAHELARSGGNVLAARKRLMDEYETFRTIGENTLRRLLREQGFAELVAERGALLAEAERKAAIEAEQIRRLREIQGSLMDRMTRDERIVDELANRINTWLQGKTDAAPDLILRAFAELTRIIDRRRESALPAIATTREATALIESLSETLIARFGMARANACIAAIRETYKKKVEALEAV